MSFELLGRVTILVYCERMGMLQCMGTQLLVDIIDARSIAYHYGVLYARPVCYECVDLYLVSLKGKCHIRLLSYSCEKSNLQNRRPL